MKIYTTAITERGVFSSAIGEVDKETYDKLIDYLQGINELTYLTLISDSGKTIIPSEVLRRSVVRVDVIKEEAKDGE